MRHYIRRMPFNALLCVALVALLSQAAASRGTPEEMLRAAAEAHASGRLQEAGLWRYLEAAFQRVAH